MHVIATNLQVFFHHELNQYDLSKPDFIWKLHPQFGIPFFHLEMEFFVNLNFISLGETKTTTFDSF